MEHEGIFIFEDFEGVRKTIVFIDFIGLFQKNFHDELESLMVVVKFMLIHKKISSNFLDVFVFLLFLSGFAVG